MARPRGISPVQRTLRELRNRGMIADITERFVHQAGPFGKKFDLFGFLDLIYLDNQRKKIVGVQVTGQHGHADHKKKILGECNENATEWLRCGGVIELWSWRKLKLFRGSKAVRWTARIEPITRKMVREGI
jgi:hypothetical protein